ncbi:MAG: choice-of-anchor tandem repeat GloVer-containing protein, partial [Chitinophagaceae bacterium]
LIQATDGFFYGMAQQGGNNGVGTIFKISSTGVYTILHHFAHSTDGSSPQGSLIQGADGYLYGMTKGGGANDVGTIFKVSTTGVFKVIRHLLVGTDGGNPEGGLIKGKGLDSNFYGITYFNARIFKISPNGVVFTVLKTLNAATEGSSPSGSLVLGADGNFYGTCYGGGSFNRGTIFKMTPAGVYTVLKHLNPIPDGGYPAGSLVQAADGNFYGMTSAGGTYNAGTIFRISSTGVYAVIRHLDLLKDGGAPFGSLIIQKTPVLIANPQSITVTEDIAKAIVLSGSGATPLSYTVVTPPKNGTVTAGTLANRTYTPKANYYGKDSFYFTVNVNCFSSPPAKVLITVTAVNNDAPVLDSIRSKQVKTGTLLTFTAKATEYDSAQTKTFSLIAPVPAGATINAVTGVFKWTPAASGVSTVKVRVSDNGVPVLFDEEVLKITAATNFAPVLDSIPPKLIKTGTLLTFTAKATDFDAGQTKRFSLLAVPPAVVPAGATIDSITGVFKWTPAASGVFKVKVRITDNGAPVLSDEQIVMITVATNFAPVLDFIPDKSIKTGTLVTFTAKATDFDAGQTKRFSLIAVPPAVVPAGATIDSITGVFKWTPAVSGVFKLKVRVTDNGVPVLFDDQIVTITAATNFAPVLDLIGNKTVKMGTLLTFTAKATDIDAGQTKTFSLIAAPAGTSIVATTGVFKWTPSAVGVFKFKVRVTDNGIPVLFDEEEITVTVTAALRPASNMQSPVTSVETQTRSLVVYPNPVMDKCVVRFDGSFSKIATQVYDMKGTLVRSWPARTIGKGSFELDMTGISQGQYIVEFNDGNKRWVVKLVKL